MQIGNNWVLTAAHCVYSVDDEQVSLNKGAMDVTESLKILALLVVLVVGLYKCLPQRRWDHQFIKKPVNISNYL